jgi:hypothetical protein
VPVGCARADGASPDHALVQPIARSRRTGSRKCCARR